MRRNSETGHFRPNEGICIKNRTMEPSPAASPLRVVMNGNRLDIQASVDLGGLKNLQAMLQKYQGILEMMQPYDDDDDVMK